MPQRLPESKARISRSRMWWQSSFHFVIRHSLMLAGFVG
jgi:hypothetical protein